MIFCECHSKLDQTHLVNLRFPLLIKTNVRSFLVQKSSENWVKNCIFAPLGNLWMGLTNFRAFVFQFQAVPVQLALRGTCRCGAWCFAVWGCRVWQRCTKASSRKVGGHIQKSGTIYIYTRICIYCIYIYINVCIINRYIYICVYIYICTWWNICNVYVLTYFFKTCCTAFIIGKIITTI